MRFKALWLISNHDLFFVSVHKVDRNLVVSTRKMLWSVKRRHCQVKMPLVCLWTSSTAPAAAWLGPIHLASMSLLWRYQRIEVQLNPVYGHPLKTETSLLRTVCFVLGGRKPLLFLYIQPVLYGHPGVNTDTFYAPLNVRINGVDCIWHIVCLA